MTAWRLVREVARREVREQWRSRSLRVSFAIVFLIVVGGAVAATILDEDARPRDEVALVGTAPAGMEDALRQAAAASGRDVVVRSVGGRPEAEDRLRAGDLDAALVDGRLILVERDRSAAAADVVQGAVVALAVPELQRVRPLAVQVVDPDAAEDDRNQDVVAIGLVLLFTALIGFVNVVAASVTEEKSSRIVEVLLTTVAPRRLLAGKVLGVGALALAQLVVIAGCALLAARIAGGGGLPPAAPETVAVVVLWFVLGYAFYSVVFAAVGALVSRQEDLQNTAGPLTVVMVLAFYAGLASLGAPDETLIRIGAFVPPLSPMLVPARVVLGDMGVLELLAVVAVQVASIAGMVVLAARVYERAILQTGAPVALRRVLSRQTT